MTLRPLVRDRSDTGLADCFKVLGFSPNRNPMPYRHGSSFNASTHMRNRPHPKACSESADGLHQETLSEEGTNAIVMERSKQGFDLVRECLRVALELDQAEAQRLERNTTAADLDKWDSLGHLKLIMELERCFGIEFDDDQIVGLASIETIMQVIESKRR